MSSDPTIPGSSTPDAPGSTPGGTAPAVSYAALGSRYFPTLLAVMCVVIVLSNIGASKGVLLGPIVTDGGFFLFPLAYVLGDVISEVYGPVAARRSIIAGFAVALFAVVVFAVVIALPGFTDDYGLAKQHALEVALGPVWRIVLASAAGFVVGQSTNAAIMVAMKKRHAERGLILRLATSTGAGELLDTVVFCAIAATAIGITTTGQWLNYVLFGFVWKTGVEYLLLPVTSAVIGWFKRNEPSYGRHS